MHLDRESKPVRMVREEQMLESADGDDFTCTRYSDVPLHPVPRPPEAGVFVLRSLKEEKVSRVDGVMDGGVGVVVSLPELPHLHLEHGVEQGQRTTICASVPQARQCSICFAQDIL